MTPSREAQIRHYHPEESVAFRRTKERFGGLSNMASGFPIYVSGVRIKTSEALYQACRFPDRPDVQRMIIEQHSPMTAKMKGRRYLSETRPDWQKVRVNIMRWCLRVKLAQHWETFGNLLLSTGDTPIVEHSRKDVFWGAKLGDGVLTGMNILGRLLVELREEMKGPNHDRLKTVDPPRIPHFLLYGQSISAIACGSERTLPDKVYFDRAIAESVGSGLPENRSLSSGNDVELARYDQHGSKMIPKECKRLVEVDFPIAEVGSAVAKREKRFPAPRGLPSTMHQWWARRPLASSRAMLMALLLPDPCDEHCPQAFRTHAREKLLAMRTRAGGWEEQIRTDEGLRRVLLRFIADFANWDNSANPDYLDTAQALISAAHPEETPLVVDPFAGGGSIPLEALRLGCEAFASDLNPVACLILKVMLEDIPRHGPSLADDLRKAGAEINTKVGEELADLYPKDPDGATPIAYLWARTVLCEAPDCGAEIPIYRSPWLSKKGASRARYFREAEEGSCVALLVKMANSGGPVEFRIARGEGRENPTPGFVELRGTKARGNNANVVCPCCHAVLPGSKRNPRVPKQLADQRGGADVVFDSQGHRIGGARLLAVVTLRMGEQGRHYRLPTDADYSAVWKARMRVTDLLKDWDIDGSQSLCPVPDEPLPPIGTLGFRVQRYGMLQWGDLFTARQKAATIISARKIANEYCDGQDQYVAELMAMALDKVIDFNCSLASWRATENVRNVFARQALPMIWDFVETNLSTAAYVGLERATHHVLEVVNHTSAAIKDSGTIQLGDAANHPLPDGAASIWFTDPPYYDSVPYADLSDFFLVWLKRTLPGHPLLRDPIDPSNPLSPKTPEVVQDKTKRDDGRQKDRAWFEERMAEAFAEGRRVLNDDGVGSVVFAHKTTEGWEALLSGMIQGGWTITGSWPIATESASRLRARDSAALATSVHLVCRPRPEAAPVGDWADVLRELPERVADWMQRLQGEGVRGADLVFACVGPALEVYSRYSRVETAEGGEVSLPEYLEKVWEVVGREALEQVLGTAEAQARNGAAGALEEDSRLTALFLWTLQSTSDGSTEAGPANDEWTSEEEAPRRKSARYSLPFDVTRRFAQPLGIHLDDWELRIIETKKGVVRLLPVTERGKQLFGESGAGAIADEMESAANVNPQLSLFPEAAPPIRGRARRRGRSATRTDGNTELKLSATTLDRVHAAMLLQASGRSQALRNLLRAEQERSPDFLRLANALTALYPRGSEEKRLLDAMLLAIPR